jgi:hypothetical protein
MEKITISNVKHDSFFEKKYYLFCQCGDWPYAMICTSVVCVNGLELTLCVSVNPKMKFICILCKCKCLISIYVQVNVKLCKSILCCVK